MHTYIVTYHTNDPGLQSRGLLEQVATCSGETEQEANYNFQISYAGRYTTIKSVTLLS